MDDFVVSHLREARLGEDWIQIFQDAEIDSDAFMELRPGDLELIFGSRIGPRVKLTAYLERLRKDVTTGTNRPSGSRVPADTSSDSEDWDAETTYGEGWEPPSTSTPAPATTAGPPPPTHGVRRLIEMFNQGFELTDAPSDNGSINILLLGESGVGKSTWISGLTNYLTFATMEEAAAASELVAPIPTRFILHDHTTGTNRVVRSGPSDLNERMEPGLACTQSPRSYYFSTESLSICLIDTPGICDTRGIDQDRENLENIILHLGTISKLHGICVLLKSDVTRISTQFQFCLKALLTKLHKSAAANIIFCFTNARSNFYGAGETLESLGVLLSPDRGNMSVTIPLTEDRVYCLDNEAIRLLAATKDGVQFDTRTVSLYAESWSHAVNEMNRLLQYIVALPPHDVSHTRKLNEARELITQLARPMAEFAGNIQDNMNELQEKRAELEQIKNGAVMTSTIVRSFLAVTTTELTPVAIEPTVVCTSECCIVRLRHGNREITSHKKPCHEPCHSAALPEVLGAPGLWRCGAFTFRLRHLGYFCKVCDCSWKAHIKLTHRNIAVSTAIVDDEQRRLLKESDDGGDLPTKKFCLDVLEQKIKQQKEEQSLLLKISSKFAIFLQHHSIALYNDAMREYLNLCIEAERFNGQDGSGSNHGRKLQGLFEMRAAYEQEVQMLLDPTKEANVDAGGGRRITLVPEDITELMEEAFRLPLNGHKFRRFMEDRKRKNFNYRREQAAAGEREEARHFGLSQSRGTASRNSLQKAFSENFWAADRMRQRVAEAERDKRRERAAGCESENVGTTSSPSSSHQRWTRVGIKVLDTLAGVGRHGTHSVTKP